MVGRRGSLAAIAGVVSACSGPQSALDPAGRYADEISGLWWIFFGVCAAVYLAVVVVLLTGAFRSRRGEPTSERRMGVIVASAALATVAILFVLLVLSASTGRAVATSSAEPQVRIAITAQQWWWHIEYESPIPSHHFSTANEIVVPVNQPVELVLRSRDVIHSFWVPNIHGKRDLIPGHISRFVIEVNRPGVYEGQCAEFCGLQHAQMRITLRGVSADEFRSWVDQQRRGARPPQTAAEQRGQQVFLAAGCPLCHTISGTEAHGRNGPDLTHLASRPTIAAGSRPNTVGHLAGWIVDPQGVKPGNRMPPNALRSEDLQALLAYLRSLE